MTVLVLGSVDPAAAVSEAAIRLAFAHPRSMARDSEFLGRSSTLLWADDRTVVKLRSELELPYRPGEEFADRRRWVDARLERERTLGVYPPDRTWFVAGEGAALQAGVAAGRRRPLHLWREDEFAGAWEWFCGAFASAYLGAAQSGWRLDEGLSNFAIDAGESPALRYLDDDLYPWDGGVGLGAAITVQARRLGWLTEEHGERLGNALRDELAWRPPLLQVQELAGSLRQRAVGASFLSGVARALTARRAVRPSARPTATRIAVLADVHANLVALETVLADPQVRSAAEVLVLGDLVGYGPEPSEVIARLRADRRCRVIMGNHDHAMLDPSAAQRFTSDARWSAEWTRQRLSESDLRWLSELPVELLTEQWQAVHGAPADPARFNAYIYARTVDDNIDRVELDGVPLCFYGNTHVAGAWVRSRRGMPVSFVRPDRPLELAGVRSALVCPGSVGQPRDRLPGAAFALFDPVARHVAWRRVDYDIAGVQQRMRAADFPQRLIDRLALGR